jgi:Cu(I)/Ag(I) efflux system membrane protein CusA/SilA
MDGPKSTGDRRPGNVPVGEQLAGYSEIKNIRGSSMFGMSFVYVIFEDNVDIYWARTRVLERLNYAQRLLPKEITPTLGPDGTGVGHIFWYHLDAPKMDLGEQRALQDWYIKFALQTVPVLQRLLHLEDLKNNINW